MKLARKFKSIPKGFWIVTFVFIAVSLLMLPFREVGFSDDFAYRHSVGYLINDGVFKINNWSGASIIFQVVWGWLFSLFFGFSYKTLHFSVLFLFYFGVISFYFLLRYIKYSEKISIISTLLLIGFPTIITYTYSFMTVIPYTSLMLISLYFGVNAAREDKFSHIILSCIFGSFAFLTRNYGIFLSFSLFLTYILKSILKKRLYVKEIITTIFFTVVPYILYNSWLYPDNITHIQITTLEKHVSYLVQFFIPKAFILFRLTNDIYFALIYRLGYYYNYLFVLLSPVLIVIFLSKLIKRSIKFKDFIKSFLVGFFFTSILYLTLIFKQIQSGNAYGVYIVAPQIYYSLFGGFSEGWRNIWNITSFVMLPILSFFLGEILRNICNHILNVYYKPRSIKIYLLLVLIGLLTVIWIISHGYGLFGTTFLKDTFFVFLFYIFYVVIVTFVILFRVKSFKNNQITTTWIFLIIFSFFQTSFTCLGYYYWQEYMLVLVPIVILFIFYGVKDKELNSLLIIPVVILYLFFSVYSSKINYDEASINWNENKKLVDANLIEPKQANISNWTWLPYYYYDIAYEKAYEEAGYDKRKIPGLSLWLKPEYEFSESKVSITHARCNDIFLKEGEEIVSEGVIRSVFKKINYCVVLKKNVE